MRNLTLVFKLLLLAVLISGTTACSKKGSKSASLRDRRGHQVDQNGNPVYVPGGPQSNVNQGCENCGYIYGADKAALIAFLGLEENPDELGTVSTGQGQSTGVFFRGNITGQNGNALQGQIEIVVWDDRADISGPFIVQMALKNSNSDLVNKADLIFADQTGSLTMNGQFRQGTYEGTVSFENNGQGGRALGQFITGDCNFITAGCAY